MITLSPGRPVHRNSVRAGLMRRTALGGVLIVMANAGAAVASPVLSSIPSQVAHAPVITTPSAGLTSVTLKQSRTLINWSSFDIAQGQQVDFLFQSNAGIVLNRVTSLALINGKLLGCVTTCGAGGSIGGNVWIFSPQGVVFGPHAQVNVGGLLATTSPLLSDQAFLDGSQLSFNFGGGPANAGVTVQSGAQLTARGALALISPSVTTATGSKIEAGGTALYAAAQNYVIHFDQSGGHGLNLLDFEVPASALTDGTISATPLSLAGETAAGKVIVAAVSQPSVMNAVISLGGAIMANGASDGGGGDIVLTASGGPTTVNVTGALQASHEVSLQAPDAGSIVVSGSISAASAAGAGGLIQVGGAGTASADLTASGRLDASSTGVGQSGGQVVLTAGAVRLDGGIAATGPAGGGTILVGGGAQGKDATVADAETTVVGTGAVIDASAGANGDGGRVVVWSNQNTQFQGTILGRGGASGGAGGAAEVSSAGYLSYAGLTDLRAANGTAGQLLLDPSELVVVQTGGSGAVSGGANPPAASATSTIGADTIDAALLTSDVTISTHMSLSGGDGVIEFNGGASPLIFANTGSTSRTLSFVPEQGFVFDTGVGTRGPLNLTLNAGSAPVSLGGLAVTDGDLTVIGSSLSLLGDIAAPSITLTASGSISQSGGVITTSKLTGSSGGATSLPDANAVGSLTNFTAGAGLTFTNAGDFSAVGVSAGSGALALTSTSGALTVNGVSAGTGVSLTAAGDLNLVGDVTGSAATFSSGGAIDQAGGVVTATTLSATAVNGISLTDANAVGALGGFANTGTGGIALANGAGFTLSGDINAPAQSVSLVANGPISQASGIINANLLTVAANGAVSLTGANTVSILAGLLGGASGDVAFVDSGSFTLTGDVAASGQTVSLVSTGGAITQTGGVITASNFSASAASGLSLGGQNEIPTVTSLSSSSGGLSFNDNQTVTIAAVTLGGGDMSLSTTSGDLNLTGALSSPGALNLSAAGAVNVSMASAVGDYSVTGAAINTAALQPTLTGSASNLTINFTSTVGTTDLSNIPLSAPGSVSVTTNGPELNIGSITAGANVTLSSAGSLLSEGEGGGITAASLTASAVDGLSLSGFNTVSSVTSLNNSQSGSLYFFNSQSVTIGPVNQGGSGSISLITGSGDLTLTSAITGASTVYLSAGANLTLDGITTPGGITLSSGGALTETPGAGITLGGDYSATAMTMDAAVEQPVFTSGSFGSLSLTFNQTGGLTDLTGVPLSAPQSVSVAANNESLTVDSITSGDNVALYSGGVLSAASGATINLTSTYYDNYSATAVSMNLANPAIVQPVFAGTLGSLSLTFTQSGGLIDLTGAPLSAPQSVRVQTNTADLTTDAITAGTSVTVNSGGALTTVGLTTAPQAVTFQSTGAMTVDSISTTGNVTLNSGAALSAATNATIDLLGDYSATAQTISAANPVVLQPTFTPGSTGNLSLTFTLSGGPAGSPTGGTTDISATALTAPGSVTVQLSPYDTNENLTVGSITAGGGVTLSSATYSTSGSVFSALTTAGPINAGGSVTLETGFACTYCGYSGGPLTVNSTITSTGGGVTASTGSNSAAAFTFNGPISAAGAVNLATGYYDGGALTTVAITTTGGDVNLSTGLYDSGALTAGPTNASGNVNLQAGVFSSGVLTVSSITAGSDVTLDAGGPLMAATPGPVTVTLGGDYSATGTTIDPSLYQPVFTTGSSGSLSLTFNDSSGAIDLTDFPLSAPGSVSVTANNEGLTVDSITAGQNITLHADGPLNGADEDGFAITLGGDYSATGTPIDSSLYQPTFTSQTTGNLSLTFNDSSDEISLSGNPLHAPGSISITANFDTLVVDSLTAGGDITLYAGGSLFSADVDQFAITLGGNYSATGVSIDPRLFQPTFTGASGNLSLTFTGEVEGGADLSGSPLTAPGSVSIAAPFENLTVDSITATGGNITLSTGDALASADVRTPVVMTAGGNYSATGATIDPVLFQPVFTGPSTSSSLLSLTFTGSGGEDMTGSALTAPGSVSISAPFENLTVDSIMAAGGVTLNSGFSLANAAESGISLGGDYSATAQTISAGLLQPTFTDGSTGSLNLTFTQSGSLTDISATPLSAPGSVSIFMTGSSEGLTTGNITAGAGVSISQYYYDSGAVTAGSIIAGGDVNLSTGSSAGAALTVGPITAGGAVALTAAQYSGGVLTVDSINAGSNVTLIAGGALQTTASTAPVVTLGGNYAATGTTIDSRLYQPVFMPGSTGSLSLTFTQTGGAIDLTGFPLTAPGSISLRSSEDLTFDSLTAAASGQVSLSASGALTEDAGSVITGQGLTAQASNGITLNGANVVQFVNSLSNGETGGISFTNTGDIVLDGSVSASGQTVNLVSTTGSIYNNYYYASITADTLTASAVTGITLVPYYYYYYNNNINNLGPITNSTSGGINISNNYNLTLVGDVSAPGQAVNLTSLYGSLSQTGGVITAGVLTASALYGIAFNDANAVTSLGALTNAYTGGISFTNGGDFALTDDLTAAGQTVNIASMTGAVSQTGGVIFADTLTGSAANGFTLNQTNEVTFLGAVSNTGSGGISFTNDGDINLIGDISAPGQAVNLVSMNGALIQSLGAITAGTLNLSAITGIDLSDANFTDQLGTVSTTSGDVVFVNDGNLTLTGDIDVAGQNVSLRSNTGTLSQSGGVITAGALSASGATGLSLTSANEVTTLGVLDNGAYGGIAYASAGDISLANDLNGFGEAVSLTALSGAVTQATGEILTAGTLNVAATNGVTLNGANAVTHLGAVSVAAGGVSLNDTVNLSLTGAIQASGQTIGLNGAASVTQLAGSVTAGALTVSAVDGISLNNVSGSLGALTNSTLGGVNLSSESGDLVLAAGISAPGQTVSLSSVTGAVDQTGGIITADGLTASAVAGITLNDGNAVGVVSGLANTGSGGISFTNAGDFTVAGWVNATGQAVSLVSTSGSITQTAGVILAQDLTLTAQGGVNLIDAEGARSATVTATTLSLTPQADGNNPLQAPAVIIESRSGLIDLGDNLTDPGFAGMTISSATAKSIGADSISFYAGYFSPTNRLTDLAPQQPVAIKVGDVTAQFGGLDNPVGGITVSLFAGPGSTVEVLGAVASSNPGQGFIVVGDKVADAWTPGSILISGSLGANGSQVAPLNAIELNAVNNILLGDSQFQQAIVTAEQAGQTQFIDINAGEPAGVTHPQTGAIFIGSNTLTLRAQGVIASQNTGVDTTTTTTDTTTGPTTTVAYGGIDLVNANGASTVLTLGTTSRTSPAIIDIFGTLNDSTGTAIIGIDLASSTAIALETPLAVTDFYRANGCVIGRAGFCNLMTTQTLPIKLIQGVTLSSSEQGQSSTSSVAGADAAKPILYTATTPLIAYSTPEPVGDPTVTGVGSEEIWRGPPACDPNGGGRCP